MKPSDHPEFFRLPPPEGRSRESSIVLDSDGRFFHEGAPVTHPGMARAFSSWIARHPDDGRFILNNGYDWSYFRVEGAPFQVLSLVPPDDARAAGRFCIELSDGTLEAFRPEALEIDPSGVVYTTVKGGSFEARFSRAAQLALGPYLTEDSDGALLLDFAGQRMRLHVSSRKA